MQEEGEAGIAKTLHVVFFVFNAAQTLATPLTGLAFAG